MREKLKRFTGDLPMEIKVLLIATIGGTIFSILTGIINLILDLGSIMFWASMLEGILSVIIIYIVLAKRQFKAPAYIGILSLVLLTYPVMWFFNAGSRGPIIYYMIFNAVFASSLTKHIKYHIILALQLLVGYVLLAIDYLYPGLITQYSDDLTRTIDIAFSFTLVFLLSFYLVFFIMKQYHKNIEELEAVKKELLDINEKLTVKSETDELTGICNRRHIISMIKRMILIDETDSFSVIMLDIDFFKTINDTHGHSVGDTVIREIAQTLEKNLRRLDTIGRIGGEEFLAILPGASLEEAYQKANILREVVEDIDWERPNLRVTISAGVYCRGQGDSLDDVLEKVDKQLYIAKSKGRNLVSK